MKRFDFFLTTLFFAFSMIISATCFADLTALSDTQMKATTAQAGISVIADDRIDMDMEIKTIAYGDEDGTDGNPAYLSFNDITMIGYAQFDNPVSFNFTTEKDFFSNNIVNGLDIAMNGVEIHMDRLDIGSITVGDNPSEGKSFGKIAMRDFHAKISGNIRITSH
jgi:hypothetical protein